MGSVHTQRRMLNLAAGGGAASGRDRMCDALADGVIGKGDTGAGGGLEVGHEKERGVPACIEAVAFDHHTHGPCHRQAVPMRSHDTVSHLSMCMQAYLYP